PITLTASGNPSGTYQWFTVPVGGTPIPNSANASYTTPALTETTTYYVSVSNGSCPSPRSAIKVIVSPAPLAPSISGQIICYNSITTLTPTGPGGPYNWYEVATGGTAILT